MKTKQLFMSMAPPLISKTQLQVPDMRWLDVTSIAAGTGFTTKVAVSIGLSDALQPITNETDSDYDQRIYDALWRAHFQLSLDHCQSATYNFLFTRKHWRTEEIIDVYKSRYEELQAAADSAEGDPTRPRIVWFHLRPYYRNSILEYIEERVDIVQTQVNYVFWDELDVSDPYRAMASKMLFHPGYCPVGIRTQMIIDRMQKGDGIIAFYPKSCRHFHSSARIETEMFKKAGIPMLIIDGDCIDSRGDDFLVMKTRIDRFLKGLQSQARNDDRTISSSGI